VRLPRHGRRDHRAHPHRHARRRFRDAGTPHARGLTCSSQGGATMPISGDRVRVRVSRRTAPLRPAVADRSPHRARGRSARACADALCRHARARTDAQWIVAPDGRADREPDRACATPTPRAAKAGVQGRRST
jgi:hypothetical protein